MSAVFVAYASSNEYQSKLIREACRAATTPQRSVVPWSDKDTSGAPIAKSVESWIEESDTVVADISVVNANVTYELGYAIGANKSIRLIRSTHVDFRPVKDVGLLDTLGHDSYDLALSLSSTLRRTDNNPRWPSIEKNRDQPIFVLQPPKPTDSALRATSAIKKIARIRFRTFTPSEVSRLNASEAYEQAMSSYGVVVFWDGTEGDAAIRNNQRACFIYGLARGRNIPALLIAHQNLRLPLDLEDQADRWKSVDEIDSLVNDFRLRVADHQNDFVAARTKRPQNILEVLHCGDPVAENEAATLGDIFLETDAYQRTVTGAANVLVGRKGSGKTAVFLQTRDVCRSDKQNIVIDLIPDGYQLVKMKEFILDQLAFGARKEVIAAFWEYVLWLEIAYKLLEKDEVRAYRDARLTDGFRKLESAFKRRVDTGRGDFSERLKRLSANIIQRFSEAGLDSQDRESLDSSKVLEIIYGQDVAFLRDHVLDYLRLKGFVLFLLDNLDRFWTPGGFDEDDALIVVGLTESMQEISRKFQKRNLDFRWAIFVRSDVYEFLVRGMADYGKLAVQSLEWSDRDLMAALFKQRVMSSAESLSSTWEQIWSEASVQTVLGRPVIEYLLDGSMMRPRYLIRLFETARRRAVTFGRSTIEEQDYTAALKELGWQVLEDLDREIVDLLPSGAELLFELLTQGDDLTPEKFRYYCGKAIPDREDVDRLLDIMIWNGSIGVIENEVVRYIFDTGYKRQYLSVKIKNNPQVRLTIHPTLVAALA
ncbi:nucleoside 2-deoxyribosyltransferase [Sphingomonas sp. MA1305]|uniref:nucleoside 2-deoxyribosyltransferase n=1 Tax=Sphingomonas sp. MA1305 TaxID=2479204 RepID=UPI001E55B79D|nr:nucleoside 2-deoxyribosyltransferase [Sphingomonas sp. MA1305]